MKFSGLVLLTRPVNAVAAGLATILGVLVAGGSLSFGVFMPVAIVGLITAAGNAVNDCFDLAIDAVNRPDRPIPSGKVTLRQAYLFSALLFILGVALSSFTNRLCLLIALFNSLLLVLYACRLKRVPIAGNLAVSYLAASIFLFGGAFTGMGGLLANGAMALVTLFAMMARELLKSAEDLEGDMMGGASTFPVRYGVRRTSIVAFACISGAVLFSLLPIMPGWGIFYVLAIACADAWMLIGAAKALYCLSPDCIRSIGASRRLKEGMFAAVAIFVAAALFG
ncbi:MAG: geranylgeranylglycerol-phosphate geranylgeranyltransferase [Methanomicrobiales archaeon]|nr:geranylgeranylglycerol-phosphate geranylgeranyltransferase [Methanomicrobiales archaeon]